MSSIEKLGQNERNFIMYGIHIDGNEISGKKPTPSEILPVFKYLKEPENYMPILMNMILDMIGCYRFPELRHEADYMKARREYLIDGAFKQSFGDYLQESEDKYYALRQNYWVFKETAVVASCSAILGGDKHLHDYCMKVYDLKLFGFDNEENERDKRMNYEYGMQFVPYMHYFVSNHLSDNNISRTVRLGACFWKVASYVWPELFPEHDENIERFMYEGKLPDMLPVLQKSYKLMSCQCLPRVLSLIYDTLEDYFKVLCPEAVSPRPAPQETVVFRQKKG